MATIDGDNVQLPEITTIDANKVVIVNTTGDDYILTPQSSIGSSIVVDSALSSSSTNPVQNNVVKNALDAKITASSDDTLTNKAFDVDGTGNTLTNIANTNIKNSAGINCSKLADGTVSNAEFQTLNGITTSSTISTQLGLKQDTIDSSNKLASANVDFSTDIDVNAGLFGRSQFNNTIIGNKSNSGDTSSLFMHSAFAANNQANRNSYALIQDSTGATTINCKTGTTLSFRAANQEKLVLTHSTGQLTGSAISTSFDSSTDADQLASVGAIRDYINDNPRIVAYGKFDGSDGSLTRGIGLTCNRTAAGNYTMTLSSARPTADYSIFCTLIEELSNRDDLIVTVNSGSSTTTTFEVIVTEQDNGVSGGTFRDKNFFVQVVDHD